MDYSGLINKLTAEMKKGEQYARMPKLCKIFMIIALFPLIISFVVSKAFYWVTLFFYKMVASPAEYLHEWLRKQKDEVQHATQAVMYWVCMPFVFGLQLLLSFSALAFFFEWFLLMVQGYVLTLGGIKWQPFITEASFEDDVVEYEYKPDMKIVPIYAYVTAGVLALYILLNILLRVIVNVVDLGDMTKAFFDFLRGWQDVNSLLSKVYLVLVFIVNPILFKRTPKAQ